MKYSFLRIHEIKYTPGHNYQFILLKNYKDDKNFYDIQVGVLLCSFGNALEYSDLYSVMDIKKHDFIICDYDVWLDVVQESLNKKIKLVFNIGYDLEASTLTIEIHEVNE